MLCVELYIDHSLGQNKMNVKGENQVINLYSREPETGKRK